MQETPGHEEHRQGDGSGNVHGAMIASPRAWTLEQNDRRFVFAIGPEAALFAESGAFGVGRHDHPA
ncbi:hypothetical protein ABZ752_22060 [Streptomyces roseifaciens]